MPTKKNRSSNLLDRRSFLKLIASSACVCAEGTILKCSTGGMKNKESARFYQKHEGNIIECQMCFRGCIINPGEWGHCEVRKNESGQLMTFSYGNPAAIHLDPIEKKPLYHFMPGSTAFSIGLLGCNIDCKFCQNWQIAQAKPDEVTTESKTPEEISRLAQGTQSPILAFTYSEPTVWSEYLIDCAKIARSNGIKSVVISNGTMSQIVLDEILGCVDAIKIDLKSIRDEYYQNICNGKLQPVLDTILHIRKSGKWLELVNLVVTTLNDSSEELTDLARWIKTNLGPDVPLHLTRFHPIYQLQNLPPTPVSTLDNAWKCAKSEGLHYVYVGNVPNHPAQNTNCPKCNETLIQRTGMMVKSNSLINGCCPKCNTAVSGVFTT